MFICYIAKKSILLAINLSCVSFGDDVNAPLLDVEILCRQKIEQGQ